MSQFYQVVNGGGTTTTVSLEELRHMYPNLQCVDNVQYHIINQEDAQAVTAYQQQQPGSTQQLIGIATNSSSYGQQQQASQGVYVLETVEQNAGQAAVVTAEALQQQQQRVQHIQQRVQQIQQVEQVAQVQQVTQAQQVTPHQQAQHVRTHFQIQQQQQTSQQQPQQRRIQQQAHLQQRQQQQQQQQQTSPQQSQQQSQTYYNNVTLQHSQSSQDNNLTVLDSAHLTARQSMQVSVIENVVEQSQYQSRVKYVNRATVPAQQIVQQQSHPQMLNQVLRTTANNAVTLQDGRKLTLEEWQQLQLHQQQIAAAAAAAAKRSDRNAGVITVTRQNAAVGLQALNSPGVQQQRNIQSPRPELIAQRRQCAPKSRVRTQNALVTNNTVQAIASPTVEKHQTLVQQESIIAVEDEVKHQQQLQHQLQQQQQLHQQQQQLQLQQQQQQQQPPPPPPQPPQQQPQQQSQHTTVIPAAAPTQILILLPNGDQRFFNFDISQGHFSVSDLLEQVRLSSEGRFSFSTVENTSVERPVDQAVTPQAATPQAATLQAVTPQVATPAPTDVVLQEKMDVKEPVLEIKQESVALVADVNANPQDQQKQLPQLPASQQQQPSPPPPPQQQQQQQQQPLQPPPPLPSPEQQQQLGAAKIPDNMYGDMYAGGKSNEFLAFSSYKAIFLAFFFSTFLHL